MNCQSNARLSETKTGWPLECWSSQASNFSITSFGSSKVRCCSREKPLIARASGRNRSEIGLVWPYNDLSRGSSKSTAPKQTMENSAGIGPSASTSTMKKLIAQGKLFAEGFTQVADAQAEQAQRARHQLLPGQEETAQAVNFVGFSQGFLD